MIWNQIFCLCLSTCCLPASHHGALQYYSCTQESSVQLISVWLSLPWFGQLTFHFLVMEIISALPLSFPFRLKFFRRILYLIISLLRREHKESLTLARTYIFSFIGFLHKYCFETSKKLLSSLSAKKTALSHCFYISLIQLNPYQWKHSFLPSVFLYLHLRYASFKLQFYHAKEDWFLIWNNQAHLYYSVFHPVESRCGCVKIKTGLLLQGTSHVQVEVRKTSVGNADSMYTGMYTNTEYTCLNLQK